MSQPKALEEDFKTMYPDMPGYAPYNHVNMGKPLGRGDVICGKIKEESFPPVRDMRPFSVVITPEIIAAHHRKPPTQEEIDRIEKFLSEFD